ncbi:basic secretory family protein [Acinetobacter oleivorans]|uniref:basic secretory family protein n=1 Tax=Acinetobacter oleivorans TaxID=1148157 RepID=UPI001CD7A552|nr:basic secretory family protein [Acinetobacter oleivorans]
MMKIILSYGKILSLNDFLKIIFFFLVSLMSLACLAADKKNMTIDEEKKYYKSGKIRVIYSLNEIEQTDNNKNNIPDYVENIAIQANATIDALDYLGFVNPLNSSRYKSEVNYIDIHVVSIRYNGIAYDKPYLASFEGVKKDKALLIKLNSRLKNFPGNYWTVVAHEIFHLYQYGYSPLKPSWYLEGMANWSERLLRKDDIDKKGRVLLPTSTNSLQNNIYQIPYNKLWYRLAFLSNKMDDSQLNLPDSIIKRKYIDGTFVFKDNSFSGYIFMRSFLSNLSLVANDRKLLLPLNKYNNFYNSSIIIKCLKKTIIESGIKLNFDEKDFLNL